MSDTPIDPMDYLCGVKVVDIGDLRVARGKSRRPQSACTHVNMVYDRHERRVWCEDCESEVEPFDAFELLVSHYSGAMDRLKRREQAVKDAESHAVRQRATKALDKAWRSRTMVPACPHCGDGLFPEDFLSGLSRLGKDYARAKRFRAEQEQSDV
jgi:hypothetical protein